VAASTCATAGAMFWTFLFPLLMLFAFGMIFRSGGPPSA
jgi:hypothetical protein